MEDCVVSRLDHLGILAGTMDDLGFSEFIDTRVGIYEGEKISIGQTIKGLVLNGLGFSNRPLSLVPQFFEGICIERLIGEGIEPVDFNRHKLSRCLDRVWDYGCERLFGEVAIYCAKQSGIDTSTVHLDTTSFSVTGEYLEDSDEHGIRVTHGYSKDHRPDLKQIVQELLVSGDGGVPLISKTWSGNSSDSKIFQDRAKALKDSLCSEASCSILVGDSKLYSKENAATLSNILFITRIPNAIKETGNLIIKSHNDPSSWQRTDDGKIFYKVENITHYDIGQTWLICWSEESLERSKKSRIKGEDREKEQINKQLLHIQAQRFHCESDAHKFLNQIAKKWKYHQVDTIEVKHINRFEQKGRPILGAKPTSIDYQIIATVKKQDDHLRAEQIKKEASFIIGTNVPDSTLKNQDIIAKYKEQQNVERGFRFLKDPLFFVSSLFLKKPERIEALLCIMSCALLVYSLAERSLRMSLAEKNETIPNQINNPTATPTLRWVFQCLEGIHVVSLFLNRETKIFIQGITDLRRRILSFFGKGVQKIYQLNTVT